MHTLCQQLKFKIDFLIVFKATQCHEITCGSNASIDIFNFGNKLMLNFVAHIDLYVLPCTLMLHTSLDIVKIGDRNRDKVVDAL